MSSLVQAEAPSNNHSEHEGYSIDKFNDCSNIPDGAKVAFFTYGRFQPGHRGHEKMIMTLLDIAQKHNDRTGVNITQEKTNVYVFVSPSGGPTENKPDKNPLPPNQKVDLLQHQYPKQTIHFVNMGEAKDKGKKAGPGGAVMLLKKCYDNGVMLVGEDRMFAFDWLGKDFLTVEGISRPPDAMSATKVRKAATAAQQTRQQTEIFRSAIQFGTVTRSHVNEIKQIIRTSTERRRLRQLKKKKSKKIKGGKRKRKTRRKTRKNKTKRRKTKTKRKRKKRTLGRYTIRRKKK
jgi:hypothetical protein